MSNPTIDWVPVSRELIAEALEGMSTTAGRRALRPKLRALLDTPACDTPAGHVCPGQGVGAGKKCPASQPLGEIDLTPKRLAHAESVIVRQNDLVTSLRAELLESYRIGGKPQGEPVAHCLLRRNGAGEWVNDAKSWADGVPCREIVAECETHPELYRVRLAYAEQPARPKRAPETAPHAAPLAYRVIFNDGESSKWEDGAPQSQDLYDVRDGVIRGVQCAYAQLPEKAAPVLAEPILVEAVAVTREFDEDGLRLDWLIEGGIAALEHPGTILLVAQGVLTNDSGNGYVYPARNPENDE